MSLMVGSLLTFPVAIARSNDPAYYRVRKGDNLTKIAANFGVTISDLRQGNNLSGDLIRVGQKLKITRPFRRTQAREIRWRSPLSQAANVLRGFGPYKDANGAVIPRNGVDIAVTTGSSVRCSANGVIRYIGLQDDYGMVMIIEHGAGYSTVMAPFQTASIAWRVDDAVLRGDILGQTGDPPQGGASYLHLELRQKGKAIKPDRLLP